MESNLLNLIQTSPLMVLLVFGMVLMLMEAFKARTAMPWVAGLGLLISMMMSVPGMVGSMAESAGFPQQSGFAFNFMIRVDHTAQLIHHFLTLSAFFTLFFIGDYLKRMDRPVYDIYPLLIFCTIGMSMLANSNDLIITFIGLETMSICLYIMAALFKTDLRSNEAGLKYFLLGAFATGFFLFGVSLIYGGTGSTNYTQIASGTLAGSFFFLLALGLLVIGFLFKVSAFPFHMWTPDVYAGTPTPLSGFMSTGAKAAAFLAFGSFLNLNPLFFKNEKIQVVLIAIAVLTMIYGNIVAARQSNLKRMLAYSSIAHTGYLLLGVAAGGAQAYSSMIFYLLVYTLMNIGAFGMIGMAESKFEDSDSEAWKGLGRKAPWFGAGLSIFLLSLAGIPPMAGFMGKYFVFYSAIQAGILIPAIIGILTSVVGAFYYIRVIRAMYFDEKDEPKALPTWNMAPMLGVILLAVLVICLGIMPSLIQETISTAIYQGGSAGLATLVP